MLPIPLNVLPSPKDQLYSVSFKLLNFVPNINGSTISTTLVVVSLNLKVLEFGSSILPVILTVSPVFVVGSSEVKSATGAGGLEIVIDCLSKSYCPVGLCTTNLAL